MTDRTRDLSDAELDEVSAAGLPALMNGKTLPADGIAAPSDQDLANGLAMEGVEVGVTGTDESDPTRPLGGWASAPLGV